jgi:hypothetical protein
MIRGVPEKPKKLDYAPPDEPPREIGEKWYVRLLGTLVGEFIAQIVIPVLILLFVIYLGSKGCIGG